MAGGLHHRPDLARRLIINWQEPAAVARIRNQALTRFRLLPNGSDGRLPTVISRPDGIGTEVYFYAYQHPCIPAHATHWLAIDIKQDREVNTRRSGLVYDPAVQAAGCVIPYLGGSATTTAGNSRKSGM